MSDEIREFIEFRTDEDGTYFYYIDKNGDEQWSYNLDNLKDYITNLQKENEELNKMCELYSKSLYCAELTDYKSRIKKAVEYINNNPFINSMAKVSIMNILRGDNDERKSN